MVVDTLPTTEEGALTLEATIVLPFLVLLIIAALQFAWVEISALSIESATVQALSSPDIISSNNNMNATEQLALVKQTIIENSLGLSEEKLSLSPLSISQQNISKNEPLSRTTNDFSSLRSSRTEYSISTHLSYEAPLFVNIGIPWRIEKTFSVIQHSDGFVEVYSL